MGDGGLSHHLNVLAVVWFWITISGVFYVGLGHVLPDLYEGYSPAFFLLQHLLCYFMFIQMIINWCLVKFEKSPFKPEEHLDYLSAHSEEIANGGYEINLNHLKSATGGDANSYKVPMTSVRSVSGSPSKKITGGQTMYIVPLSETENQPECNGNCSSNGGDCNKKRVVYPYWSWKPCVICACQRPPRAHHCPLCNTCVLKRDHHCFFTGSCIGLRNQRHFVVFSFWAALATSYCMVNSVAYMITVFMPQHSFWDILIPVTIIRWILSYVQLMSVGMIFLFYSLIFFCLTSVGFFAEQIRSIRKGVTSFEVDNNIKITSTATPAENFRGVFGKRWIWNFLVPLHYVYPTQDDGVSWKDIKA